MTPLLSEKQDELLSDLADEKIKLLDCKNDRVNLRAGLLCLLEYANHDDDCAHWLTSIHSPKECDCGYDEMVERLDDVTVCRVKFEGETYDLLGLMGALELVARNDGYDDLADQISTVRGYIRGFKWRGILEE